MLFKVIYYGSMCEFNLPSTAAEGKNTKCTLILEYENADVYLVA